MKKSLYTIFICSLISISFDLYLSSRSYSLSADAVGKSAICHINDPLNCDNALASDYSEFAGIPLSDWGFATHLLIALLSFMLIIGWVEKPSFFWLALVSLSVLSTAASLIMMSISAFVIHLFCPFCIILYVLSFIIVACALFASKQYLSLAHIKEARLFLPATFIILVLTGYLSHLIFMNT